MSEKQFTNVIIGMEEAYCDFSIIKVGDKIISDGIPTTDAIGICDLLNELYEEKEDWKNNCLKTVSENSILWNEISILREQGAEPSDAFKNYLNGLTNKIKKLQEDLK